MKSKFLSSFIVESGRGLDFKGLTSVECAPMGVEAVTYNLTNKHKPLSSVHFPGEKSGSETDESGSMEPIVCIMLYIDFEM
ncbi:hypothetical protein ACTXT7_011467 [Hymenolepis weldensis]